MTTDLEAAALSWLRYERRCFLVCLERHPCGIYAHRPDVIGVLPGRQLVEIEVKRSISDLEKQWQKRWVRWSLLDPCRQPRQFYFMAPAALAERAKETIGRLAPGTPLEGAGLLTLKDGEVNPYTGLPPVLAVSHARINHKARKLGMRALGRMVQHQSGTLARLASTNALLEREREHEN